MARYTEEEIEAIKGNEAEFEIEGILGAIRCAGIAAIMVLGAPDKKLVFEFDQVKDCIGWTDRYRIFCKQEKDGKTTGRNPAKPSTRRVSCSHSGLSIGISIGIKPGEQRSRARKR